MDAVKTLNKNVALESRPFPFQTPTTTLIARSLLKAFSK